MTHDETMNTITDHDMMRLSSQKGEITLTMIESESTDSSPKHDLEQGEEIMATNMVHVGFYAKRMINTDHQ